MPHDSAFEKALEFTLKFEGGYVDHPKDPGKATNLGISQRAYPDEDIKGMTRARAAEIYRRDYWAACHCAELPAPVALLVFDLAVISGTQRAKKMLQRAVAARVDGIVGAETLERVRQSDTAAVLLRMAADRDNFHRASGNFITFGKGWLRRSAACYALAVAWLENENQPKGAPSNG